MKLIDIKNLTYEYFRRDKEGNVDEMIEALNDISLDIKQGEFIAILGQNGSGKSTLAKHLNALLLPAEGNVVVDGMDTLEGEVRLEIRKTAGMIFQNPDNQIIGNIVEEDVAFGPENLGVPTSEIRTRVDQSLMKTGMFKYSKKSPNQLSGGQKQRVAIAGVLAMQSKCIIFDEATAMLDPKGRKQMIAIAKQLQEENNITIIFITHHMDEVLFANRVFVMNHGKIVGEGRPIEIFKDKELLDDCGLKLPIFYEYMHFLIGQDLLTEKNLEDIQNLEDLVNSLVNENKKDFLSPSNDTVDIDKVEHHERENKNELVEGLFLNHVSYIYNKGLANEFLALSDINVKIGRGEFVAVIGQTGSGKSTFMQHLNGLYLPTEGSVFFDGMDITDKDFSLKQLRQRVGLVFQYPEYQLFAETVEQDVCFGPMNMDISKVEAQKRAYEALRDVGLPDTIYDCSPLHLSGGQKRRVAIAGVLAMHPEYLILDEPTAGLDPISAEKLLNMLKNLQKERGITIVIVSHDMEEVVEYADRILVMHHGRILMDDCIYEVFKHAEEIKQIGLEVPIGISLLHKLKENGFQLDLNKYRRIDICSELLKIR